MAITTTPEAILVIGLVFTVLMLNWYMVWHRSKLISSLIVLLTGMGSMLMFDGGNYQAFPILIILIGLLGVLDSLFDDK